MRLPAGDGGPGRGGAEGQKSRLARGGHRPGADGLRVRARRLPGRGGAARPHRHPGQQRRALLRRALLRLHPGALPPGHGAERGRGVLLHPGSLRQYGRPRRRLHHQHQQHGQQVRPALRRGLPHQQVRRQRPDPLPGPGAGARRHPGQRRGAGHHQHGHDARRARGAHRAADQPDPPAPHWRAGGSGPGVPVPGQPSRVLYYRGDSPRGRPGLRLTVHAKKTGRGAIRSAPSSTVPPSFRRPPASCSSPPCSGRKPGPPAPAGAGASAPQTAPAPCAPSTGPRGCSD